MKIKIRKQVVLAGQVVRIGEVVEASLADANILIGSDLAEVYNEPPEVEQPVKPKRRRKATNDDPKSGD
jgi:hypothetical protein|tara:strand:+ start:845 stop:1051 length:207 start_codon:yes stop_codon:yes gene_type:complete